MGARWTSWNMIDNLHRADQASLEVTDAARTAAGFDRVPSRVLAGRWVFRWGGVGSL